MGSLQKCRFADMCKFYDETSFPCSVEEEAEDYCGKFNMLANLKGSETLERNEL